MLKGDSPSSTGCFSHVDGIQSGINSLPAGPCKPSLCNATETPQHSMMADVVEPSTVPLTIALIH